MRLLVITYALYKDNDKNLEMLLKIKGTLKEYGHDMIYLNRDDNGGLSFKILRTVKKTECDIIIVINDDDYISHVPELIERILTDNTDIAILADRFSPKALNWVTMFFPRLKKAKAPISSPVYAFRKYVLTDNIKGVDLDHIHTLLLEILINGNYKNLAVVEVGRPAKYKSGHILKLLILSLKLLALIIQLYLLNLELRLVQTKLVREENSKAQKDAKSMQNPPNN